MSLGGLGRSLLEAKPLEARILKVGLLVVVGVVGACSTGSRAIETTTGSITSQEEPSAEGSETDPETDSNLPDVFTTLPPGSELPDTSQCAAAIAQRNITDDPIVGNAEQNQTRGKISVDIDGASEQTNARLASRVVGDFTGTTEEILVWGACKWGFDEDITRARAVAESSWRMSTFGDPSSDESECSAMELATPCDQSYGLLQVKGSVHLGTYPTSLESTSFGVDYAMAWLRSCYEGSFTWLDDQGYEVGDEWGCVGAWFSGNWYDNSAKEYIEVVQGHLRDKTWLSY